MRLLLPEYLQKKENEVKELLRSKKITFHEWNYFGKIIWDYKKK